MGGCKCTFRDCKNKTSNNSSVHFFHFPLKHPEKLKKWVKYANAESVLKLEQKQAKNKVVCSAHFRDECFMNYKKNRITKKAIPTLVVLYEDDEGKVALDYETSENPEPVRISASTAQHLIPPKPKDSEKISPNNKKRILNGQELNTVSIKKFKLQAGKNYNMKIIEDKNDSEDFANLESITESDILQINVEELEESIAENLHENESHERIAICENDNPLECCEENEMNLQKSTENLQEPEEEDHKIEKTEITTKNELETHTIKVFGNTIRKIKSDSEAQINALKQELKHKDLEIKKLTNEVKKNLLEQDKLNKTSLTVLNKEQIFNLIKKYLCPSMSSLVRMEMFGNPEREWKEDEKDVAIELLQLGETVFNYFRDEWRFRLPPQKDVEQWLKEK